MFVKTRREILVVNLAIYFSVHLQFFLFNLNSLLSLITLCNFKNYYLLATSVKP